MKNLLYYSTTVILCSLLSIPAFGQAQTKEEAPFFQVPGGKKSFFKLSPTGNPPEIVWSKKNFPGGFYFNPGETDWTKYNAVEFDLVSDGVPVDVIFKAANATPNVYLYSHVYVNHKDSKHFVVLIKNMKVNSKPVDLSKIVIGFFERTKWADSPDFKLIIRNLKLSKLSDAELAKAEQNLQAEAQKEAPLFQTYNSKVSFFKLRPAGYPPEFVWTKKTAPNGFYFNPGVTDWTKYNAVEFDLESNGVPVYFQFRANNDRPSVFLYEEFHIAHKGGKHIILPIKKLKTNTKPVDLTQIVIGFFSHDAKKDEPEFSLTIRNLKLSNLSEAELTKAEQERNESGYKVKGGYYTK